MTAPTVAVTVSCFNPDGTPCPDGTRVSAVLDRTERYQGFIVPNIVTAQTTAGIAVLNLFPNNPTTGLGTQGSQYQVTAGWAGSAGVCVTCQVPNTACTLDAIADTPGLPAVDPGTAAVASAQAAAGSAGSSATAAAGSASAAATSATNASASAQAAFNSAGNASTSAGSALTASNNASAALASANTAATNAGNSATAASTSAGNAATSATNASNSATAAATSATQAANSATAATTNGAAQVTLATNQANAAAGSAAAVAANASAASTSAANAHTSEVNAKTSETNAATSATNAATSAGSASTSASAANTSAVNAASSASSASTSAGTATSKASDAATSASNAATSAASITGAVTAAQTAAGTATAQASAANTSASLALSSSQTAATSAATAAAASSNALAVYGTSAGLNAAQQIMFGLASTAQGQASLAQSAASAASSVAQQDLSGTITAQALHRSPNAVTAMFVYDVSKDSDGGAWTERMAWTSWMQEALNGTWRGAIAGASIAAAEATVRAIAGAATGDFFQWSGDGKFYKLNAGAGTTEVFRGNTTKFPKQAAIVAEASSVTIYDLTNPGRPMFARFVAATNNMVQGTITSVGAMNADIVVGSNSGAFRINMIRDTAFFYSTSTDKTYRGNIAQRGGANGFA